MNWKTTFILCIFILLVAGTVTAVIFFTEPSAKRETAVRRQAMLVDTVRVSRGSYTPKIVAMGTVQPARDIFLSPRVGGRIVEISPSFSPGRHVTEGSVLVRIDPADYLTAVQQHQSDLLRAEAELTLEQGRQNVARQDYRMLDRELAEENEALILRKPQLKTVKARLESARAALRQAELDLERTAVRSPFPAHILSREVNVGSQVSPGDILARMVGVDTYWVETTVPRSKLSRITIAGDKKDQAAFVRIYSPSVWPGDVSREGKLTSLIGALERQTRLARLLVSVSDPLALDPQNEGKPKLIIGAYVEVHIEADEIDGVVRLNRDYLRQQNSVWVMEDGRLAIRKVNAVFKDAEYAYIDDGLEDGELVVTTNLATVTEGAKLRRSNGEDDAQQQDSGGGDDGQPRNRQGGDS